MSNNKDIKLEQPDYLIRSFYNGVAFTFDYPMTNNLGLLYVSINTTNTEENNDGTATDKNMHRFTPPDLSS